MSFNARKNLKQNNSNNDGGGGVIISGEAKKIFAFDDRLSGAIGTDDKIHLWGDSYSVLSHPNIMDGKMIAIGIPFYANLSAVLKPDGTIFVGGDFEYHLLYGNSAEQMGEDTVYYDIINATNVIDIRFVGDHFCYLKSDGTLKILSLDNDVINGIDSRVISNVSKVESNYLYGLILKTNGTLEQWPFTVNPYLQLGLSNFPSGLTSIINISCGITNFVALKSNGDIIEWGYSPLLSTRIPKPTNLNNIIKLSSGGSHTIALLSNGTVIGWGDNFFNQISIPTGLSNIIDIATGSNHSMALRSDGKVICWGYNNRGVCETLPIFKTNSITTKKVYNLPYDNMGDNYIENGILLGNNFGSQHAILSKDLGFQRVWSDTISPYCYRDGATADKFNFIIPYKQFDPYDNLNTYSVDILICGGDRFRSQVRSHSSHPSNGCNQWNIDGFDGFTRRRYTSSSDDSITNYRQISYLQFNAPFNDVIGRLDTNTTGSPVSIMTSSTGISDGIIIKNSSNSEINNKLVLVGRFDKIYKFSYTTNQKVDAFNMCFTNPTGSVDGYLSNTTSNHNFHYTSPSLATEIRSIVQYKKDYIIFGGNRHGARNGYSNFFVTRIGGDHSFFAPMNTITHWNNIPLFPNYFPFWIGAFGPALVSSTTGVYDIEVQEYDDKILVGGSFPNYTKNISGSSSTTVTNVNNLCRLTSSFDSDTTFNTNLGTGFNDIVNKIHIQLDNKILVGGKFTSFNGVTTNRLVRLNSDGTRDNTFNIGTGFNGEIFDIEQDYATGEIFVSGNFSTYNNENISGMVKLKQNGAVNYDFNINREQLDLWNGNYYTQINAGITSSKTISSVGTKFVDQEIPLYFIERVSSIPTITYKTLDDSSITLFQENNNIKLLYPSKVTELTCSNINVGAINLYNFSNIRNLTLKNLSLTSILINNFNNNNFNSLRYLDLSYNKLSSFNMPASIYTFVYDYFEINLSNNSLTGINLSSFILFDYLHYENPNIIKLNLENNNLTNFTFNSNMFYFNHVNLKNNKLPVNIINNILVQMTALLYGIGSYPLFIDISGGTNASPTNTQAIDEIRSNGGTVIHN